MKKILLLSTAVAFFCSSCRMNKDFVNRTDKDKVIFDIVKTLKKSSTDEKAVAALPVVYPQVQQMHLDRINSYKKTTDINRWDKIINEYNILQSMYDAITGVDAANRLVLAGNYVNDIYFTKESAAADYYQRGDYLMQSSDKNDAKQAYAYFKRSNELVPGYKEAKTRMDEAYRNAIINVIINPVQDNSFFFNTGWGNYGSNYSNQYFQQTLVRELGGKYSSTYPADFYTDAEARNDNVQPDWVIDLALRNINIPRPFTNNYSRTVSKEVEAGKDTSGKPMRKTIYATINITKRYFTASAQMDVTITDAFRRKNISYNTYTANYDWQQEHASYTGDSRALSNEDWALINYKSYNDPRKEDVLNELYRKLYPQVKNVISYAVDW